MRYDRLGSFSLLFPPMLQMEYVVEVGSGKGVRGWKDDESCVTEEHAILDAIWAFRCSASRNACFAFTDLLLYNS